MSRPTAIRTRTRRRSASPESLLHGHSYEPTSRFERLRVVEWPASPRRTQIRELIEQLDPTRDATEIVRLSAAYDLVWEYRTAAALTLSRRDLPAQLLTVDDVALLQRLGLDAPAARPVMSRLRSAALRDPDGTRRLLLALAVEPDRVCTEYGWRYLTPHETRAIATWYRGLARRLQLTSWPTSWTVLEEAASSNAGGLPPSDARAYRDVLHETVAHLADQQHLPWAIESATTGVTALASAALALTARTPLRPVLRAALREVGLVRRQIVLLRSAPRVEGDDD